MIFGFNTDVQRSDGVHHVQTEDRGTRHPVIESIVYLGGKILGKKRTPYDPATWTKAQIEEAVRLQHKELTEAVRSGTWVAPSSATADGTNGASSTFSIELVNPTSFHQGEFFRFQILVAASAGRPGNGSSALETRWLVDGMISDQQRLDADADGRAELWVPAPELNQSAVLIVKAQAAGASGLARFVISPRL